jgi:hypothetical protein
MIIEFDVVVGEAFGYVGLTPPALDAARAECRLRGPFSEVGRNHRHVRLDLKSGLIADIAGCRFGARRRHSLVHEYEELLQGGPSVFPYEFFV